MSFFRSSTKGTTGPSGSRYMVVPAVNGPLYLQPRDLGLPRTTLMGKLNSAGVSVSTRKELDDWVGGLAGIDQFPEAELVEHFGWNGRSYVTANGMQFTPKGLEPQPAIFSTTPPEDTNAVNWKHHVGRYLYDQEIITFTTMTAFAAPLLDLVPRLKGVGFNLVGPTGCGKSSLLTMVSGLGGVDARYAPGGDGRNDPSGFGRWLATRQDQIINIDGLEATLAGETERKRIDRIKNWLFRLANGRDGASMYLIASRVPVAEMCGDDSDVIAAASDKLFVLDLSKRPLGVLSSIPRNFVSANAAVTGFVDRFKQHAAPAMARYAQALVNARHDDERGLRSRIETLVSEFCNQAGADPNRGSEVRDAEAFGIVYAAGRLAQEWNSLHDNIECGSTVLECFRLHQSREGTEHLAFEARLRLLLDDPRTVEITKGDRDRSPEITAARVFKHHRTGFVEIWIREACIKSVFPDWYKLQNLPEVRKLVFSDDHKTAKRTIVKGTQERVYCFRLHDGDGSGE